MRSFLLTALAVLVFVQTAHARTDLDCLSEAVLAESTMAKEPLEADQAVAYSVHLRSLDGRWGKTVCDTVNKRYGVKKVELIKVKKSKKVRWIQRTVFKYQYDYSYKLFPKYVQRLKSVAQHLADRARLVASVQLMGGYEPPAGFEHMLHYMRREHSSASGSKWFDCVTKPLGRVHEDSKHVMFRDATDEELEVAAQEPGCTKFVEEARTARARRQARLAVR